jgi:(p)ppGpp synthase/HD superfamily hydrolase
MINKAKELAQQWMRGHREGPGNRHAWEHPQDVVALLQEMPGYFDIRNHLAQVAWLHDVIEDGRKSLGDRVVIKDLFDAGVSIMVANDVLTLSHAPTVPRNEYLAGLSGANDVVKIIKCLDRVCNLREGAPTFKNKRWIRYVGETCLFIHPLTEKLEPETREWLSAQLLQATQLRPLYRSV